MGMYDHFLGEQFKIFYTPVFMAYGDVSGILHSGGCLGGYNKQSILPLKTLYYKYPLDFLVVKKDICKNSKLTDEQANFLLVINGKIKKVDWIEDNQDIFELKLPVYDNYGKLVNVKTFQDIEEIKKDKKENWKEIKKMENKYFPEGSIQAIKNDADLYIQICEKEKIQEQKEQIIQKYKNKWYPIDPHSQEMQFGELLYCYKHLLQEGCESVELERFRKYCVEEITQLTKTTNIENKYLDWVDTEEFSKKDLLNLVTNFEYFLDKKYRFC